MPLFRAPKAASRRQPKSLERLAAQHDAAEVEVRVAAVVADVCLRRDVSTPGQDDLAMQALRELIAELVTEQPYRRRGLQALEDQLESIVYGDALSAAAAAERLSEEARAVDVPAPLARALPLIRRQYDAEEGMAA